MVPLLSPSVTQKINPRWTSTVNFAAMRDSVPVNERQLLPEPEYPKRIDPGGAAF